MTVPPKLYKFDDSRRIVSFDYSIYEEIKGEELKIYDSSKYFFKAGEILAKIHSIEMNFFHRDKVIQRMDLCKFYEQYFNNVLNQLKIRDEQLFIEVQKIMNEYFDRNCYQGLKPVLLHHDYHIKNIIVDHSGDLHIIDWDSARGGIAEVDLLKIKYLNFKNSDPEVYKAFFRGYQKAREMKLTINFPLQELIWLCKMYLFESDWHLGRDENYFPKAEVYKEKIRDMVKQYKKIFKYTNDILNSSSEKGIKAFFRDELEV